MRGGAPSTPLYSFRDIIGHNSGDLWGWNGSQLVDPTRFAAQGVGGINRWGVNTCISTQIQTDDHPIPGGSNRNEVLEMFGTAKQDESAASGTQYYGLSVYIPSTWIEPNGATPWFIIAQMHGDDTNIGHSAQANFQFLLASSLNTASHYTLRTVGGPITGGGSIPGADDKVTDLGAHVYDTWVDFVFEVTWGSDVDGTGHVTVYKRVTGTDITLQQIADYSAPNLYSVGGVDQTVHYWKRGIYRNPDDSAQGTATIYVSPFTRSSTIQAACVGSFGQYP